MREGEPASIDISALRQRVAEAVTQAGGVINGLSAALERARRDLAEADDAGNHRLAAQQARSAELVDGLIAAAAAITAERDALVERLARAQHSEEAAQTQAQALQETVRHSLAERDAALAEAQRQEAARQAAEEQLKTVERKSEKIRAESKELGAKLGAATARCETVEAHLREVLDSTSWKLTAPARRAIQTLRRTR